MFEDRAAGILLHPTSLPGPYGIGSMGAAARRFLRALRAMGVTRWQILPPGPTGYGDSPYQALSAFAGNPLWIDLDGLRRDGLLPRDARPGRFPRNHIDFGRLAPARVSLLRRAAEAFPRAAGSGLRADYAAFAEREAHWLDDFALYDALKAAHDGRPWTDWPTPSWKERH